MNPMMPETTPPASLETKPPYVPPRITTYTSEEIQDQVGPALTCSPSPI
jgi:hypothetical protein